MTDISMAPAGHRDGFLSARDGTPLSYRLVPAQARTGSARCVLIHSLAMDKTFWNGTVEALAGDIEVLVFDCRGHGASGKPAGPYDVGQFADDIADLMDHLGWSSATVAGASMGGCVALAFAAAYPQRVDGLGLFDTTCWYGDNAVEAWTERGQKARTEGMAALVGFQKSRWFSDTFRATSADVVDAAVAVFLANDTDAYALTCAMLGTVDLRRALASFDFPCRVAVGEEDYATPLAMAEQLATAIPGATLEVLPGARHFTPLELPVVIAGILRDLAGATWAPCP